MDLQKHNKQKYMEQLNTFIDDLINERNSLAEKLRNYNKDEQITKLLKENINLRGSSLHILSDKEKEQMIDFQDEHWEKCKGNTRYILEGTGVGTKIEIQCIKCGVKKDITDYNKW